METPVRRVTRSQLSGLGPSSAVKTQGRKASSTKKKELPRPPFTDLTNDSPISGLMPAKMAANTACVYESTPRSKLRPADRPIGEDLLRMQVTSLLRKVESEALIQNKFIPSELLDSPMRLAAPTPANTPATSGGLHAISVVAQAAKPDITVPTIVISSPVCRLEGFLNVDRTSPAFVSTAELLSSIEETSPKLGVDGAVGMDQQEQPTTRTLRFDSPEKRLSASETESINCVTMAVASSMVYGSTPASLSSVSTEEIVATIEALIETSTPASISPVPTAETLASIEEEQIQPTTRTLKFESPEKRIPHVEKKPTSCELAFESTQECTPDSEDNVSGILSSGTGPQGTAEIVATIEVLVDTSIPASISPAPTAEALASIEETSAAAMEVTMPLDGHVQEQIQPTTRTLRFESPEKPAPYAEKRPTACELPFESPEMCMLDSHNVSGLLSSGAQFHGTGETTDDEDAWSVIVNVHSPEKTEGADSFLETVPTSEEDDDEAMDFLENVLVDPEHRIDIPAKLWERRDTPGRPSALKDDDDYEDCEEYDEEEEEEETYEDGPEVFDEACEELCIGISHINMGDHRASKGLPAFEGKHIRFNYNSDNEIEEGVVVTDRTLDSPGKMRLNGYPTPKGKHLRFDSDGEE